MCAWSPQSTTNYVYIAVPGVLGAALRTVGRVSPLPNAAPLPAMSRESADITGWTVAASESGAPRKQMGLVSWHWQSQITLDDLIADTLNN